MKRVARISSFVIALLLSALAHAQVAPVARAPVIPPATPILAHNGMVVAQESRAARIGVEILDRGVNAVDAAVAATATMFLDAKGNPDPKKSRDSGLAVGVPGTVAGLALAREKYCSGKLSLADLIAPAIRLAQQGFPVEDDMADSLPRARERLARWSSSAGVFLNGGQPLLTGDRLLQFDLADTLKDLAPDPAQ